MTPEMAQELIYLRDRFGISATEALYGIPAWEYDLLTRSGQSSDDVEIPEGADRMLEPPVPEALRGL